MNSQNAQDNSGIVQIFTLHRTHTCISLAVLRKDNSNKTLITVVKTRYLLNLSQDILRCVRACFILRESVGGIVLKKI